MSHSKKKNTESTLAEHSDASPIHHLSLVKRDPIF